MTRRAFRRSFRGTHKSKPLRAHHSADRSTARHGDATPAQPERARPRLTPHPSHRRPGGLTMSRTSAAQTSCALIPCRQCRATPAQRGDHVSDRALEYLCCRCLMAGPPSKTLSGVSSVEEPAARGTTPPPPEMPDAAHTESTTSNTIFRPLAAGRAFRPGRPRSSDVEKRRKARDRHRAHRRRQADPTAPPKETGTSTPMPPPTERKTLMPHAKPTSQIYTMGRRMVGWVR